MSETENRRQSLASVLLTGLVAGVICYCVAELFTPRNVANPGDHDLSLAVRLGFLYAPLVGIWLAWLQRSLRRAAVAVVVGVGIGFVYMWLCSGRNFLAIMVGFPTLLGSVLAAALGSNANDWLRTLPLRVAKGLLAGFVLGFVYMFVLN